jgi:hypothetical protein
MSYRSWQRTPRLSTRGMKMRMALRGPWSPALQDSPDERFLRSWLEQDSEPEYEPHGRTNWGVISGLALAVGVSATFWVGVGWILSRI